MSRVSKAVILLAFAVLLVSRGFGQVSVLTQHNDTSRTGQNLQETLLNTSTVNVANFGKLFSLPVDGNIFAQPLYVPGLTIGGATHNVVYVATAQNSVFAFDADSGNTTPLWTVNLGTPVPSQDICSTDPVECPYTDMIPVIGIIDTPVIDPVSGTIYVVANTKDTSSKYHFKLHALDWLTGAEKFAGPTEITASGLQPLYRALPSGVVTGERERIHGLRLGGRLSDLARVRDGLQRVHVTAGGGVQLHAAGQRRWGCRDLAIGERAGHRRRRRHLCDHQQWKL